MDLSLDMGLLHVTRRNWIYNVADMDMIEFNSIVQCLLLQHTWASPMPWSRRSSISRLKSRRTCRYAPSDGIELFFWIRKLQLSELTQLS